MAWIQLPEFSVEICTEPVTREQYEQFSKLPRQPLFSQRGTPGAPVVNVSAEQAIAYAHRRGGLYRLPNLDEMLALARHAKDGLRIWACWSSEKRGVRRRAVNCLSEWLDCFPDWGAHGDHLRCITHPPWLLAGYSQVPHAALTDKGYSFVTFRLVRAST